MPWEVKVWDLQGDPTVVVNFHDPLVKYPSLIRRDVMFIHPTFNSVRSLRKAIRKGRALAALLNEEGV